MNIGLHHIVMNKVLQGSKLIFSVILLIFEYTVPRASPQELHGLRKKKKKDNFKYWIMKRKVDILFNACIEIIFPKFPVFFPRTFYLGICFRFKMLTL